MLIDLLQRPRLLVHERAEVARMLERPWCWPEDEHLATRARELGFMPPRPAAIGETAVVTVSEGRRRSCLYRFGPRPADHAIAVPFSASAQRAFERVNTLVTRSLGALRPSELAVRRVWSAELLARDGEGIDAVVDGPSFGLGMALAIASVFLRRPVSATLLASAEADADGRIGPVGGIDLKLTHIASNALAVRRVLVAAEQTSEAARAVEALPRGLEIAGVSTLQEALVSAFDFRFAKDELASLFEDEDAVREVAGRLFDRIVDGSRTALDWPAVRQITEVVRDRLEADEGPASLAVGLGTFDESRLRARERIAIAHGIVGRHAGYATLLPWPRDGALRSMPRPRRLRLIAHLVQSATEWTDEDAREYVERARAHLAPRHEQTEGDLALSGAIGRALASIEADAEALAVLDEALAGWIDLGAYADASFALAEYLRMAALVGDVVRVERLTTEVAPLVAADPRTTDLAAAHVAFAVGRAEVLVGRPESAVAWLTSAAGIEWSAVPASVRYPRARWLARAHAATGDPERAGSGRATLEHEAPAHGEDEQILLARLDAAIEAGELEDLDTLVRHPRAGRETSRILARREGASAHERIAAVADRYRY